MTITFQKTGTFTNAFLGDSYRTEYVFSTLNALPVATLIHADFKATIKYNDTTYKIEPVTRMFTGKKYEIIEDDSIIGHINGNSISLSTGKIFEFKRRYKSIWERFWNGPHYWIQIQSGDDLVSYEFVKEVRFDKGYSNEKYRELKGVIHTSFDNLALAIFGVFLIERLLDDEGN
jgi:hypothetical protein